MSADQSNLSKGGYNMVTATTQAAVNATMKQWLYGYKGTVYIQAYAYGKEGDASTIAPVDFDKLKTELGFDPFSVASGQSTANPKIVKMMEKKLACAFAIKIGFPDQVLPADLPNMITFSKAEREVDFNLITNTFQWVDLQKDGDKGIWTNKAQDEDEGYCFAMKGKLSTRKESLDKRFDELPEETKKFIQMEGRNIFRIVELLMTLDASITRFSPKEHEPSGHAKTYLTPFILNYVGYLKADIVLGFSVVARKNMSTATAIVPTAIDFVVSPYYDSAGNPTDDYDAYTLNYLVMSDAAVMPAPVPFKWNWVDKDQTSQYAGVAAVSRDTFAKFLNDVFSKKLHDITLNPSVSFTARCLEVQFIYRYFEDSTPKEYKAVSNGGSHILTYSWYRDNYSSDHAAPCPVWGKMDSKYVVQSDVFVEGTVIRQVTELTAYMNLSVCEGEAKGNYAKSRSVTKYTVGVDIHGKITVSMEGPDITDLSDDIKIDGWLKFISMGDINKVVANIKSKLKERMDKYLVNYSDAIKTALNSSDGWVFPGGKTFAFKDARFSAYQDLVAHILFLTPRQLDVLRTKGMTALLDMLKEEEKENAQV